jgi:hypothetical protein
MIAQRARERFGLLNSENDYGKRDFQPTSWTPHKPRVPLLFMSKLLRSGVTGRSKLSLKKSWIAAPCDLNRPDSML